LSSHRILIIDYDESSRKFLGHKFQEAGYTVFAEGNAKEGLISAFQHCPHIIIIDPATIDISLDEIVRKIRNDRRTKRSKLIALTSPTYHEEEEEIIALGFDYYLMKGGDVLPTLNQVVKEAIVDLVDKGQTRKKSSFREESKEFEEKSGDTIVFLSAKGGTGTSSICANLAHIVNEHEKYQVAVADFVLPIGSISPIVSKEIHLNLIDISKRPTTDISPKFFLDTLTQPENWNFQLLAGSFDPRQANELNVSCIPTILNSLRNAFDYIFIDLGKSLSRISLPIIKSSDQIVIILSLDEATVNLTLSVWNFLLENGINKEQVYMLINRAVGLEGFSKSEVEEQFGMVIPNAIPYMGRNFTIANNQHLPILHKFPDDTVTIAMRQAVQDIQERLENRNKSPDLLQHFFRNT
jgi:MinD-like ATPase involved in chromosome partitioning or flagellar assembly/CheY-like chemotaxis protein